MEIDPLTIRCQPGFVLVLITEVLGGMKKGLFHLADDSFEKDTATGKVLQMGPRPSIRHVRDRGLPTANTTYHSDPWPESYPVLADGDVIVFPRDVPKAFSYQESRYALIKLDEILMSTGGHDVEVMPWRNR